jgi:phage terminase small subunit
MEGLDPMDESPLDAEQPSAARSSLRAENHFVVKKLNEKQRRFVGEYLFDVNGTQATIRAGYSPRSAKVQAARLLAKANVWQAVQNGQAKKLAKLEITADRVLAELARVGFSDLRSVFDDHGHLRNIHTLSDDAAAALASIEVTKERTIRGGQEDSVREIVTRVRFWDKVAALGILAKHFGLLKDLPSPNVNVIAKVERVIVSPGA